MPTNVRITPNNINTMNTTTIRAASIYKMKQTRVEPTTAQQMVKCDIQSTSRWRRNSGHRQHMQPTVDRWRLTSNHGSV